MMDENLIADMEKRGIVTGTFRRLSPARKERIYRACLDVFAARSYDRATLDEIARRAEAAKGSLVQYFINKENVFKFVAGTALAAIRDYWESYRNKEKAVRIRDRLEAYFVAELDFWLQHEAVFDLYVKMHQGGGHETAHIFAEEILAMRLDFLTEIIRRGKETRELNRDIGDEYMSFILIALTKELVDEIYAQYDISSRREIIAQIRRLVGVVLDGIRGEMTFKISRPGEAL
jgi:AcrR family transcriptional regulator